MTLERARQLLQTQISFGGGYNRQGARLILAEVERVFGFAPGTSFVPRQL